MARVVAGSSWFIGFSCAKDKVINIAPRGLLTLLGTAKINEFCYEYRFRGLLNPNLKLRGETYARLESFVRCGQGGNHRPGCRAGVSNGSGLGDENYSQGKFIDQNV